jgi:predicted dehydrogenase
VAIQGELANGATIDESHSGLALHDQASHVTVFGSEGTLRVEFGRRIQFGRTGQPLADWQVPADQTQPWQVEADFVDAVRAAQCGEAWSVSPDFTEALRYMRKMQAVHDSAARRAVVDLDADYPLPA